MGRLLSIWLLLVVVGEAVSALAVAVLVVCSVLSQH